MYKNIDEIKDCHKYHGSNDIKIQVYQCGTFCILGSTNGRNHRGHTGSDILTHDNGQCCSVGNCPGHT